MNKSDLGSPHSTGGIFGGWGPPPIDLLLTQNYALFLRFNDYLKTHARVETTLEWHQNTWPGQPPDHKRPKLVCSRLNAEDYLLDVTLAMATPERALAELNHHFGFAPLTWQPPPFELPPSPTPAPPGPQVPLNPIGEPIEGVAGAYAIAAGYPAQVGEVIIDTSGRIFRCTGRLTPFGWMHVRWELQI